VQFLPLTVHPDPGHQDQEERADEVETARCHLSQSTRVRGNARMRLSIWAVVWICVFHRLNPRLR
jgi:hypothetical protein